MWTNRVVGDTIRNRLPSPSMDNGAVSMHASQRHRATATRQKTELGLVYDRRSRCKAFQPSTYKIDRCLVQIALSLTLNRDDCLRFVTHDGTSYGRRYTLIKSGQEVMLLVRMLKPHFEPNRTFCDTSMTFGTYLV